MSFYIRYPADSNTSIGTTGITAPTSATEIAGVDAAGNLIAIAVTPAGAVNVASISTGNANGSTSVQSVTTVEGSQAAPANAVGVLFEAESGNAGNIRWGISNSAATILSSTVGMLAEPGRDGGYLPVGFGAYLHYISVAAGTNNIDITWILSS